MRIVDTGKWDRDRVKKIGETRGGHLDGQRK